jgi:hypothetical protein
MSKKLVNTSILCAILISSIAIVSCKKDPATGTQTTAAIETTFKGAIDINHLETYAAQNKPNYIRKDNMRGNVYE